MSPLPSFAVSDECYGQAHRSNQSYNLVDLAKEAFPSHGARRQIATTWELYGQVLQYGPSAVPTLVHNDGGVFTVAPPVLRSLGTFASRDFLCC